jgi:RNA polymerase sigma-70 factor (ECF subfamily)
MGSTDEGSTSPTLLSEVADWRNDPAWSRFREVYDPMLRRWCRGHGLDASSVDEVCQCIWIELARRMQTFRYDPSGTFRGWLRRMCESRVHDYLRRRQAAGRLFRLDDRDEPAARGFGRASGDEADPSEGVAEPDRSELLDAAERVQSAVRARIKPQTWEAFWLVSVCDWTVERTADALGMTRTAVHAARQRTSKMLADEGRYESCRRSAGF